MSEREEVRNYKNFKEILKGTEAESLLDDDYAFAYVVSEKDYPDGTRFVSFRTGYNTDRVISFLKKENEIFVKSGYRQNYGNYECFPKENSILEIRNFGFGSVLKTEYDLKFNEISQQSERSFGSCCD